ncbi:MAG: hypothetical protein ACOCNX_00705 [Prevotella sp.]
MAKMKAGWMITATFDEYTKVAYFYDFNPDDGWQGTLEPALERFYHDDYTEIQDAYEDELTRFPLDCKMIGLPDNDGQVELEYHLIFDPVSFRHYFDLGWSASSSEPNERYTFERFFEDIDDDGPKEKCALVMNLANKLNNFERHTFDIVKKEIDELGVPLDKSWTLTWKKEYSQEVGQDLSTCTIMEGDKQVYKTNVHDDVSLACLEIQAFIEGVKAVLAIEQEGSIEADLKR